MPVIFQRWAELVTERSFQIHLSGLGDDSGNSVKGDLSTFGGFCYNMPSVHITLDKSSMYLTESQLQITVWA